MRWGNLALLLILPVCFAVANPLEEYRQGVKALEAGTAEGNRTAVRRFQAALKDNPFFFRALRDLGVAYYRLGQHHLAKKALEGALVQQPYHTGANLTLAKVLLELKLYPAAAVRIKIVLQRQPRNVAALYTEALYHWAIGRYDLVRSGLQAATSINPSYYPAWILQGRLFFNQKKYALAEDALMRAVRTGSNTPETHYRLAEFYYARNRAALALAAAERCLRLDPQHYLCAEIAMRIHIEQQEWEKARPFAVQLVNAFPDRYLFQALAALIYNRVSPADAGFVPKAVAAYMNALRLNSSAEEVRFQFEEFAVTKLPIRSTVRRRLSGLHLQRGDWYYDRNQLARAETAYRRAIRINPVDVQARTKLALLYRNTGRWESLFRVLGVIRKLTPVDTSLEDKFTFYQTVVKRLPSREAGIRQFQVRSDNVRIWVSDSFERYNTPYNLYGLEHVYAGMLRDGLQVMPRIKLLRPETGKTGGDSATEARRLAMQHNADFYITGRYIRNDAFFIIEINLFSVRTGELLYKRRVSRRGNLRIFESAAVLAGDLNDTVPFQGRIVSMIGDRVTINLGKNHGIKAGDRFYVHSGASFRSSFLDSFGKKTNAPPVGVVKIDQVDELVSFGEIVSRQTFDGVSLYQSVIAVPSSGTNNQSSGSGG